MISLVINSSRLELSQGDITQEATEAIVNAANSHLAGGGGVDGAIHRAGGPAIMKELKANYNGCPTGSSVLTGGGNLKAKYIIHAVGPRYGGSPKDATSLRSAHLKSLKLCTANNIKSVSFCAISTGIYGYPVEEAAPIAIQTTMDYLKTHPEIKLVRFVLFDTKTYNAFETALKKIAPGVTL
ncbi:MAG: macro domain-containing protein [Elusimicrobia bacterium]|nr:macro domain-containing protein [Elusimicrobiota bacterium]